MRQHYIICVLSTLAENRAYAKPDTYTFASQGIQVQGVQTNEAPVKTLIKLAYDADDPITGIIYLASKDCKKESIPQDDGMVSAERFFRQKISQFYDSIGKTGALNPTTEDGFFIALDYNEKNPTDNLEALIDAINRTAALIDIDSTGGPRDAVFLIPPIVQFIEAKYSGFGPQGNSRYKVGMGTVLYSSLGTKQLYRQESTFELTSLINGLNSFTLHGKADMLCDYFGQPTSATQTSKEMRRLCDALQRFSDDLALCQVADIDRRVAEIHNALDAFEESTKRKIKRYNELKQQTEAGDSSEAVKGEMNEVMLRRGELLFMSLVPTFRSDFIPTSDTAGSADQLIEVMRWCVRRKMLQQALSLYNERVIRKLEEDLLTWNDNFPKPNDMDATNYLMYLSLSTNAFMDNPDDVRDNARNLNIPVLKFVWAAMEETLEERGKADLHNEVASKKNLQLRRAIGVLFPELIAGDVVLSISEAKRGEFTANLIWYYYLHGIRNEVMHAKEEGGHAQREQYGNAWRILIDGGLVEIKRSTTEGTPSEEPLSAIRCIYSQDDSKLTDLTADLYHAIDALQGNVSVTLCEDLRGVVVQKARALETRAILDASVEKLDLGERIGAAVGTILDRRLSGCAITWDDLLDEDPTLEREIKEWRSDLCAGDGLRAGGIGGELNKWVQRQENRGRFEAAVAIRWRGIELTSGNASDLAQRVINTARLKNKDIVCINEVLRADERTKRRAKAFKSLPREYPDCFESAPHVLIKI